MEALKIVIEAFLWCGVPALAIVGITLWRDSRRHRNESVIFGDWP